MKFLTIILLFFGIFCSGYCFALSFEDVDAIEAEVAGITTLERELEHKQIISGIYEFVPENFLPLNRIFDKKTITEINKIRKDTVSRIKYDIENNCINIATFVYQNILKNVVLVQEPFVQITPEEQKLINYRICLLYTRSFAATQNLHKKDERLNFLSTPIALINSGFKIKFKPVKKSTLHSKDVINENNKLNLHGYLVLNSNNNFNAFKLYLYIWEDIPSGRIKTEYTSYVLPKHLNFSPECCPFFELPSFFSKFITIKIENHNPVIQKNTQFVLFKSNEDFIEWRVLKRRSKKKELIISHGLNTDIHGLSVLPVCGIE